LSAANLDILVGRSVSFQLTVHAKVSGDGVPEGWIGRRAGGSRETVIPDGGIARIRRRGSGRGKARSECQEGS
jgi:hypothetical protein